MTFDRVANTTFYCTKINLPALSIPAISQKTPMINLFVPGNKMEFEPLVMTFMVDDTLSAWNDLFIWLTGLSGPTTNGWMNLANTAVSKGGQPLYGVRPPYSDGILTINTAKNNPMLRAQFYDLFPTSLSGLQFEAGQSADMQIMAIAEFRFSYYVPTYINA